ncbi:MAG: DUF309 domain-containing protein [Actinomycetota bacterium]
MPKEAEGKTGKPTDKRLKPKRPRDDLGRPQPWESPNELELEDFDNLSRDENHRLGVEHFNSGRYFPAHEAWETAWKQSRDTPDAEFFKGLSQLGAGYVHLLRGNRHGATTLLRRAARRIKAYPAGHFGINTREVSARSEEDAKSIERGDITPGREALTDAPRV